MLCHRISKRENEDEVQTVRRYGADCGNRFSTHLRRRPAPVWHLARWDLLRRVHVNRRNERRRIDSCPEAVAWGECPDYARTPTFWGRPRHFQRFPGRRTEATRPVSDLA